MSNQAVTRTGGAASASWISAAFPKIKRAAASAAAAILAVSAAGAIRWQY